MQAQLQLGEKLCTICYGVKASSDRPGRMMCLDCRELVDRAINALSVARREGVARYGPSSWRDSGDRSWTEHAIAHIAAYRRGDNSEDHLSHAICDLVMIYDDRHLL